MRKKKITIALMCLIVPIMLSGCGNYLKYKDYKDYNETEWESDYSHLESLTPEEEANIKTIKDIAYDVEPRSGYTIYIKENGEFEPYLVLTSDYDGDTLLVRKYLLDEKMDYTENTETPGWWDNGTYAGYYDNCTLDTYLNTEFIKQLSETTQDLIVTKDIIITDRTTRGDNFNDKTMTIPRDVFTLSQKEIWRKDYTTALPEGETLKYFLDDYHRRVAYTKDEEPKTYWTRTVYLVGTYRISVISYGNVLSTAVPDNKQWVRPVFCVNGDTNIIRRTDIIEGETVYTLE